MTRENNAAGETPAEKETGRLEAFSDGVFAIAITLLVLDLKVPVFNSNTGAPTSRGLALSLSHDWPSYLAFVTSFASVLIMWVHHHSMFRLVGRVDTTLLFANGLSLLMVSFVPFPTAVVADYLTTPAAPAACAFYAGTFVVTSVTFYVLQHAAFRPSTLKSSASAATLRVLRRSYRMGPPMYLVALAIAPFRPWVAMGICTALWVFWAATTRECPAEGSDGAA